MSETKKETKKEPKKVKLYNNRLDRTMAPVFRALTRALGMPDAIEYDEHFSADDNRPGQFESWDKFNKSVDKWYDATNTGHSVCVPNPRYCPDPEYFGLAPKKEETKKEPKKVKLYNNRLDRSMAPVFRALTRALGMPDAIEYDDHFSADDNRPGQFESWDRFNKSVDKWYDATNTGHSVCVPNPRYCPDPEYFGLAPKKEEKPEPKKTTLEAAELKNHLRAFKMLVESVADDEQYDKKKMSELVDAGLEQLIQIVDDFAVKKETKEEKDQREMDEFKDILDSI